MLTAYSYVIWAFVGDSNRTAVSVNKQFLTAVEHHGKVPKVIRADLGGETLLLANSQLVLSKDGRRYAP